MKLKEIQNLIKFVAKSGASEVSLEMENVKITVKTSNDSPKVVVQEPIVIPQQPQATSTPPLDDMRLLHQNLSSNIGLLCSGAAPNGVAASVPFG